MIQNRELTMDDYLAMLRRRMKVILIPVLLAPLAGYLVSRVFPAKYTSQSVVQIEAPKIPDTVIQSVFSEDLAQRIATIQTRMLSPNDLRPMVERLGLARPGQNPDDLMDTIRGNVSIVPVITDLSEIPGAAKKKPGQSSAVAALVVNYTAPTAREAQQVCTDLTSMLMSEDLKLRQDATHETTQFLTQQVEQAKQNLDDQAKKLAEFKNEHSGRLPEDEDNNMKILLGLNTQLDANTQNLNRATQDKAYTESLLAQQLVAWKTAQSTTNPQTLQQQLAQLQAQLGDLQAKYTDDHPDVIKTKADIEQVKKRLAEIDNATAKGNDAATQKESNNEPPEIRQLRLQIHQYSDLIAQAERDQKKLQQEISKYNGWLSSSPAVEEQYKELARDYDNAQKVYQDDIAKQNTSKMASQEEQAQEGEQIVLSNPATFPDSPSFPNRLLFAGGGLGAGLVLGLALALGLELRDTSIRTQADAEAVLALPMLVAVPWVMEPEIANGNGGGGFFNRKKHPEVRKESVKV